MSVTKMLLTCLLAAVSIAMADFKPFKAIIPPLIDGELDDACWKEAQFYSDFYIYNTTKKSSLKTEFAVVYTETHAVFGFRCLETPSPKEPEEPSQKTLFRECVEVMLDPTGGKDTYFHFAVGRNGATLDRACEQGGYLGDKTWESNFEAKVKLQDNSWTCELAVPYRALELREGGAKEWSFNVTRESTELASIAKNGAFNVAGSFHKLPAPDFDLRPYSWEISPVTYKLQKKANKYSFVISGELMNHTGSDAKVNVTSTLLGPKGVTAFTVTPNVNAAKGKTTKYQSGALNGGDSGDYKVFTQIRDVVSGRILSERVDAIVAQYQPLAISIVAPSYRNAIFATQKLENVVWNVNVNLPEKERKDTVLESTLATEDGKILFQKKATPGIEKANFSCPNSKLPEGRIVVSASLTAADGKQLGRTKDTIRKLQYRKNEVFRGDDGNWYIDGKKTFLLLGWNSSHSHQPGYVATLPKGECKLGMSSMGFGLVSTGFRAKYEKEGWTDYSTEFFTKRAQNWMTDESLFAHYWLDEPDCGGWSREFATRVAKLVAEVDPWHPVIISSGTQGVTSYPDSGELNGFHCYPSPKVDKPMANFSKIVACLDKYNREKVNFEKPQDIVYLHQGFNYGDHGSKSTRVPSYEEFRNQNLLALAMGCTGILHYNRVGAAYPELLTGMRELTIEQKIVGEHAIIQQPIALTSPVPELKLRAFKNEDDGSFWILAVYGADGEVTLDIPVPQNGKWQVLSEKRSITAKDGKLQDKFTSFQAHVYTTDKTDFNLKSVDEIVKAIDAEYEARRKLGNLAYQRYENQVLSVSASSNKYHRSSSSAMDTCLWHVTDGLVERPFPDLDPQSFCDATPKQVPDWIALTFHKPVTAGKVLVYPDKNSLCDFEVQISTDGENWTCVQRFENSKDKCCTAQFTPQEIKAVRVFVTKNNGPNTLISEIEVYPK